MKEYPRFKVYLLLNSQKSRCFSCNDCISAHNVDVENIVDDKLFCNNCVEAENKSSSKSSFEDENHLPTSKNFSNILESKQMVDLKTFSTEVE